MKIRPFSQFNLQIVSEEQTSDIILRIGEMGKISLSKEDFQKGLIEAKKNPNSKYSIPFNFPLKSSDPELYYKILVRFQLGSGHIAIPSKIE